MALRRDTHLDPVCATRNTSSLTSGRWPSDTPLSSEEDVAADVDEPPESQTYLSHRPVLPDQSSCSHSVGIRNPQPRLIRQESLLTRALLTSPKPALLSETGIQAVPRAERGRSTATASTASTVSTAELTSDCGLTSPSRSITPSPPLSTINNTGLTIITPKGPTKLIDVHDMKPLTLLRPKVAGDKSPETSIEAGLGRKRCITFACGRRPNTHIKETQSVKSQTVADTGSTVATEPQKRPCLLTFACPFKPPLDEARKANKEPTFSKTLHHSPPSFETDFPDAMIYDRRPQVEPVQHFQDIMPRKRSLSPRLGHSRKSRIFNHQDLKRSEATSFHEFASSFDEGDEWIYEQTAHRHKITVNDTLRKENAIRKLGEEAEEEALDEEDVEGDEDSHEYLDEVASANDDFDGENHSSDGGNESDDEEGFADSDDSDAGSEYQFWTPALTTAATSTDHIRPVAQRTASESSFESIIHTQNMLPSEGDFAMRARKNRQVRSSSKMRPGTPDLPDSTDFVCGTFDEDRPLEVAYMSCLEERRRARHKLVPQDIDPSFPTSDSDDDHNCDSAAEASDEHMFIMGRPDKSDDEQLQSGREKGLSRRTAISPLPSPKPRRSPPPPKRHLVLRSPPPRRLFGHSPKHLRSPPATHGNWNSPPSSRRTSFSGSVRRAHEGIDMPHLAQRPNLTHTKSLPRTPNPFWRQHGKCRHDALVSTSIEKSLKPMGSQHSRGPIDIVKGLENKRQRRKEKYWRQQYRSGAKDRDCRCQPGKGAERMKELGLEIAGKGKGYGQKARLVLSV